MNDSLSTDPRFAALLEAVDMQLEGNRPPFVRSAFERLKGEGFSEIDAKLLIGAAFTYELWRIKRGAIRMDMNSYKEHLKLLPTISWERDPGLAMEQASTGEGGSLS
jgi:hypothetical protein